MLLSGKREGEEMSSITAAKRKLHGEVKDRVLQQVKAFTEAEEV